MPTTASSATRVAIGRRRQAAITAALATLAMAPFGMFANFTALTVAGGAVGAATRVLESTVLLRLAVVAFVAVVILDVVVAWAFARFFADRGDGLPTLAAWLRLTYAAILAVATTHLAVATQSADLGAADADVSASLVTFSTMWQLGLVVFAAHLAVLATLVIGDADAPTLLGAIIAIAAAAYAVDGIARLFLPADAEALTVVTGVVAVASIIGEIGLGVWLLARGGQSS